MEYLVFGGVCIGFILAVIGREIYMDRKKQARFKESLRKDYGQLRKREYSAERLLRIDRYFRKHVENGQLDDITWNDLGMDDVFRNMNHTYSAIGEEYLYYTLRSTGHGFKDLEELEKVTQYFIDHEGERVSVQLLMAKLGYMGKYSLYDYLDHLDYLGKRSNRNAYIRNALFFACLALMPFAFSYALIGMVVILIMNNLIYYKQKSEIEPYVISFVYILKLLDCCEKIEKQIKNFPDRNAALETEFQELDKTVTDLKPLRKGSFWVLCGNGSLGGDPAGMIVDYVKMAFHVDLIHFNRMLAYLRGHVGDVDRICTGLGKLETCIAIGAFRAGLRKKNGFSVPKLYECGTAGGFPEENKIVLNMTDGYHPLLEKPILNSVDADKGILITGSNASGKSTFLKTVALNAILAQTIHTCTCASYRAPLFSIYSSMALRDDLQGGESYYIVEIKALKRILEASAGDERPVLCFVDEVLRGTNTVERIAASTQILKSLAQKHTLCFAATHDIELTELLDGVFENYHFTEEISGQDVVFPYLLMKGKATSRNAIRLLEMIGYDEGIIREAEKMAEHFLDSGNWTSDT